MSFNLTVVSHPTVDVVKPSLMLEDRSTGERSMIGNVPSGLQRKCNEMRLRTSRLSNIFLSGILDWNSLSGLPGLILTVSDQGVKSLSLHHSGNKFLHYMMSCWRYFIFRFGLDLKAEDNSETVKNGSVDYTPVNIASSVDYGNNENKDDDHAKLREIINGIFPFQKDPSKPVYNKTATNFTLPKSIINPRVSTNWIITPVSIRGKFMVNAAKELGCEVSHFKPLCNFESVTLKDGTVVKPQQVLEPTRHFNPVLILDIPSAEYITNTISHNWSESSPNNLPYSAVYHFLDDSIENPLGIPEYVEFIKSFGPTTIHFISHRSYCPNTLNYHKTLKVSLKWKTLLKDFFPLPKWVNHSDLKLNGELPNVLPLISGQNLIIKSVNGTELEESTKLGSEISKHSAEDSKRLYNEEIRDSDIRGLISQEDFNTMIDDRNSAQSLRRQVDLSKSLKEQVETLILGTGSAIPAQVRNVISNLIRIPYKTGEEVGFRTIVLDAGENSFGTLRRIYLPQEVDMLLDELCMVYLSHLHADHHLGIVDFIREWNKRQDEIYGAKRHKTLVVITPWQYDFFIDELNRVDPFINKEFLFHVSCDEFMLGFTPPSLEQLQIEDITVEEMKNCKPKEMKYLKDSSKSEYVYQVLGMSEILACSAYHCEYSYSTSFSFRLDLSEKDNSEANIFKVSYSGDTRPKSAFSYIGKNSDLLIHESTLEDEKLADAVDKRHSTTSEALQVGILMKAKKIILTHFSQRYKSFTCSETVYKRLRNPVSKIDLIENGKFVPLESEAVTPKSAKSYQSSLQNDPDIPLEAKSVIFADDLNEDIKDNAAKIEVLFAFDNMKVQYDQIYMQREVFEKQRKQLEKLFPMDDEEFVDDQSEQPTEKTKPKKVKKQKEIKNPKKRKLTPPGA